MVERMLQLSLLIASTIVALDTSTLGLMDGLLLLNKKLVHLVTTLWAMSLDIILVHIMTDKQPVGVPILMVMARLLVVVLTEQTWPTEQTPIIKRQTYTALLWPNSREW